MKGIWMLISWYLILFVTANLTNFILILMSKYYG